MTHEPVDGSRVDDGHFENVSIGDRRTTRSRTITEADVVNFAGVSGDFNRFHTDAEAMADSTFGERIAHGALVFSVMTGLLWQSRRDHELDDFVAFYGVDRLRFAGPVFVGDTVYVEQEVVDTEPSDHPDATGLVRYETTVVNQRDEPVLVCELLLLLE